jgi:hypothetical protein
MTRNDLETRRLDWEGLLLPVVLVATGAVILAAAHFGLVSLERVQQFWPASIALVALAELFPDTSASGRGRNE